MVPRKSHAMVRARSVGAGPRTKAAARLQTGMASILHPTVLTWSRLTRSRGLASLSPSAPPCPGQRPDEWAETHRRCGAFVARSGARCGVGHAEAVRGGPVTGTVCGWTRPPGADAPVPLGAYTCWCCRS
ncbi:hypothetical protein DA075_07495 [Methylobacterium currus]|uniref:Uncharacterized protein n=1 Tax=Methylobacterium currus TaxID=2051553 RepID=A0A2R4WGW2_9HYPH|nr:hypothetical protein DA075_07495 [Methylobacterium currus]